jgi:hypothetical protein
MNFFLRLKHWQLFLLMWAPSFLLNVVITFRLQGVRLFPVVFPAMMVVFTIMFFGWIWAIATTLQPRLPAGVKLNVAAFRVFFLIPIIIMLAIAFAVAFPNLVPFRYTSEQFIATVIIVWLIHVVCSLLVLRFAAKTMKSVELGRMAKFGDYVGEFFLIWFSVIGVWILQPRLNNMIDGESPEQP